MGDGGVIGLLLDIVSGVLLLAGTAFYLIGAIGLNRMPDVYTRMHATSVSETMGLGLLFLGMLLQAGFTLIGFKLVAIFALVFLTAPIATHALARAAMHDQVDPLLEDEEGKLVATDMANLFPELERRLAEPLTSESVTLSALDDAEVRAIEAAEEAALDAHEDEPEKDADKGDAEKGKDGEGASSNS